MIKNYSVKTPVDFKDVIIDIFTETENKPSVIIALAGDLGAGKTTFTQELAKFLGVSETVTSPTFAVMKIYPLEHERFDTLVHIDTYRFENESEAEPLRLKEMFSKDRSVVCVEWPDKISSYVPTDAVRVSIDIGEGEERRVVVETE